MRVLSLFDGISCGRIALDRAGIKVDTYYASEIDEDAIAISKANYPDIIQLGDVNKIDFKNYIGKVDMIIGGSPCQDISTLKMDGKGLQGDKSGLFYKFYEALNVIKPKYFLLENVVGRKAATDEITELIGVQPYKLNSALVSGQSRNRYYWTNIPLLPIEDKHITLQDILEPFNEKNLISEARLKWLTGHSGQRAIQKKYAAINPTKAICLTTRSEGSWNSNYVTKNGTYCRLSPIECERLQTLPDDYTSSIKDSARYKVIGNGWTVDMIAHIFRGLNQEIADN